MRTDVNYSPSDVFLTLPATRQSTERLAEIGETLDTERREIMLRRDLGLTKLYNLVNDPEIADAADPDVARMRRDPRRAGSGGHGRVRLGRCAVGPRVPHLPADDAMDGQPCGAGGDPGSAAEGKPAAAPAQAPRRPADVPTRSTRTRRMRARPSRPTSRRSTSSTHEPDGSRGRPGRTWSTSWNGSCSARWRARGGAEAVAGRRCTWSGGSRRLS